jgi:alkanesulfonate monooxygenase SsuD/methylene tetrahydromethanopterin reductase-like flavin-dependent oxidoreductase (luciferase family)
MPVRWAPHSAAAPGACGERPVIRTGIVVPTFRDTPDEALEVAHRAFAVGVDGVFCYDHLWPIGQPDRPALAPFPILATLAASYTGPPTPGGGPFFGTLVARTGLVPNAVLVNQFAALAQWAPGRVIAGLGTGDRLSEEENLAYGIPFAPAAERRRGMVDLAQALRRAGLTVWLAGGPAARVAESLASGAALNVWDADPELVATRAQGPTAVEVTWGGPPPKDESVLRQTVRELDRAGATWVIFATPINPSQLVAAAREAGGSSSGPGGGS